MTKKIQQGQSRRAVIKQNVIKQIDGLSELIGRSIAWLTLAMVFVTCLVVLARYLFNLGSVGLQESVIYMHGAVFMLGIAYTLKHNAHVRVDVFYEGFSRRTRALIDLAGTLLLLIPVAGFILWSSLDYVSFSWELMESSAQPGGLPGVYLLKSLIPVMAVLLLLQGVSELLKSSQLLQKELREDEDA